jgi:hypothetical protein
MSTLGKSLESMEKKQKQPAHQHFIDNVPSVAEPGGEACTPAGRHTQILPVAGTHATTMSDTLKELLVSHGVLMSHGGESSHPIVEPSLPLHNANDPAQAHTISVLCSSSSNAERLSH